MHLLLDDGTLFVMYMWQIRPSFSILTPEKWNASKQQTGKLLERRQKLHRIFVVILSDVAPAWICVSEGSAKDDGMLVWLHP